MDYAELWNSAISEVLKTTDNEEERNNLEVFRNQVILKIEGRKIVFTCNSSYIWGLFVSYANKLYGELERLLGNPQYSFGVEVQVTSPENQIQGQASGALFPNSGMAVSSGYFNGGSLQDSGAFQHSGPVPGAVYQGSDNFNPNYQDIRDPVSGFTARGMMVQSGIGAQGAAHVNAGQFQGSLLSQEHQNAFPMNRTASQFDYLNTQMGQIPSLAQLQQHQISQGASGFGGEFINQHQPVKQFPQPQAKNSRLAAIERMFPNFKRRSPINPNKTFENYVIDPENKTLFATAIAVATNPGSSNYNPLYIYGGSGLGKTHLLFAIANRIMQLNRDISIIYTRAEEFIRHYVESMASIKKSPFDDQQVHFQDLYTEHDVFIVDDIQNFIKGPKARDAFFDIIAEFIDKPNRQLILASDVPPGNLNGFNARLTTRFGSGVCCEVVTPGVETRTAITISKCEEMKISLSDEVINYIAVNVRSNIRELEGAIKTLNSHMLNHDAPLTVDDAKKILANLLNASNQVCTIDAIKERVSREFEVTVASMESAEKKKTVSLARSVSMALARDLIPTLSLADIGRAFNKDHSSVHEAIKRIQKRIDEEPEIASKYNRLSLSLKKE